MALLIYNRIADSNQAIDWVGFDIAMEIYNINNVEDYWDYMGIIKDTISNFDRIYDNKRNTPEVKALQALINSNKKKGKK